MADITAIAGISGSGKTLLAANRAYKNYLNSYRIYSNFDLDFHGNIKVPFKKRYVGGKLDYIPIFEPKDLFKIKPQGKWSLHLDEIDAFGADENYRGGADSYDYQSDSARLVSQFFKKRLRRMDGKVDYTVQHMGQVPKRIREETVTVLKPKIYKKYDPAGGHNLSVPLKMKIEHEFIDVGTGEFYKSDMMSILKHPVFGFPVIFPEMLDCYDTRANPLSNKDVPDSMKNKSPKDETDNEEVLTKVLGKIFGTNAIIERLKESGRYSQWHGDILVNINGTQLIIDVTADKNRYKTGDKEGMAMTLDTSKKWKSIPLMLDVDRKTGSTHFFAYYNRDPDDPENKQRYEWNIIPVEVLENECHMNATQLRNSKFLTREKNLRVEACLPSPIKSLKKMIKQPGKKVYDKLLEGVEG
jgi:hypothetical protein